MKKTFRAKLIGRGPKKAWTHLPIPFDVREAFGRAARVAVAGTINGFPFRSTLTPEGGGKYYLMVNAAMRAGANVKIGDTVSVVMESDTAPRVVAVPDDLQAALSGKPAGKAFPLLAYSHQKEFVDWIVQAKKPETRVRRIAKCLEMLAAKKTPKG